MKLSCRYFVVLIFLASLIASAQTQPAADPYKPVLDRLQAITTIPLKDWRIVSQDLPHGEIPPPIAGAKQMVVVDENFSTPVWLYYNTQIPEQVSGYNLKGSRVSLDVHFGGNETLLLSIFVNGNLVTRTDDGDVVPIALTQNAQAGEKFSIAVRVLRGAGVGCCGGAPRTVLERAQLLIEPDPNRPDPTILRQEVLAAEL
ncbi:MAG TPA: hypothetical protein VII23_07150, partial [Terriglobales bacterium]